MFTTTGGRIWCGSAGTLGARGVFFANSKQDVQKTRAIDERLATLDVSHYGKSLGVFSIYVPDRNHPDVTVDVLYE